MKEKKTWRRVAVLMVAMSMIITSLTACGTKKKSASTDDGANAGSASEGKAITYPLKTKEKLSIATGYESQVASSFKSLGDTPYGKELQKETGITLEFQTMSDSNAFNLLFASGQLPDIISYQFTNYPGGAQKAITDGIIYPINDLIKSNAPDLLKVLNSDKDFLKGDMTSNGDYIGFPFIKGKTKDKNQRSGTGIIIRDDWCKELGIDLPQTTEDFYQMLKQFKEKKGATSSILYNELLGRPVT
ncbi:MAG: extracellular solute-binding protein [Clostridiales bacterium]|nr:extracellular solute-binding protein [Clostridiales bacterium]HBM79416.1 hypothetical protein [Clostridiaceae bacterium]